MSVLTDATRKPALIGGLLEHWDHILTTVLYIAAADHAEGKKRKSGNDIFNMVTSDGRIRHQKLLSTVYNQYRDELESI